MEEVAKEAIQIATDELIRTYGVGLALLLISLFGAVAMLWKAWADERRDHTLTRKDAAERERDLNKQINDTLRDQVEEIDKKDRLYERSLEVYESLVSNKRGRTT